MRADYLKETFEALYQSVLKDGITIRHTYAGKTKLDIEALLQAAQYNFLNQFQRRERIFLSEANVCAEFLIYQSRRYPEDRWPVSNNVARNDLLVLRALW